MCICKHYLPTGFRFNPTDEELIEILERKVSGQEMPLHGHFIVERNLYDHEPQHIEWDNTLSVPDNERYCYCMRETDSREVSGRGWWKATGHVKKIYASKNQSVSAQEEMENIRKAFQLSNYESGGSSSMGMHPDFVGEQQQQQALQNLDNNNSNDPFETQFNTNYYVDHDQLEQPPADSPEQLYPSLWFWQN
ncbi:hypothetical protein ACOSQ4_006242 [Xanthoceras sorbifolium]